MRRALAIVILIHLFGMASAIELPERPSQFLVDPNHLLGPKRATELTQALETYAAEHDTEVFLVIGRFPRRMKPSEYAQKLGKTWSTKNWGVIFHHPDEVGTTTIATGGPDLAQLDQASWGKTLKVIQDQSAQHWTTQEKLDFLARQLAETISFPHRVQEHDLGDKKSQQEHELAQKKRRQLVIVTLVVCMLALAILLTLFVCHLRKKTRRWLFPTCQYNPRLGAPHAGGNDICRKFPSS